MRANHCGGRYHQTNVRPGTFSESHTHSYTRCESWRAFASHGATYQYQKPQYRRSKNTPTAPRRADPPKENEYTAVVKKLDQSIKRRGWIEKSQLQQLMDVVVKSGAPSSHQILLVIKSCGSLLAEERLEERIHLVDQFWNQLKAQGVEFETAHYNFLLNVYIQNGHEFSPFEFLASMADDGVEPNRLTYQRLIAAHCNKGEVKEAKELLEIMKTKSFPLNENIYCSLITGYARAGEMENAKEVLNLMRESGIEPSMDTTVTLMLAHGESGNAEEMEKIMTEILEQIEGTSSRTHLTIAYRLGEHGYSDHVTRILEKVNLSGSVPDAVNASHNLVMRGEAEAAFEISKKMKNQNMEQTLTDGTPKVEHFFLRSIIKSGLPVAAVSKLCDQMVEVGSHGLLIALRNAMREPEVPLEYSLELIRLMHHKGLPLRPHYFWPLIIRFRNDDAKFSLISQTMKDLNVAATPNTVMYSFQATKVPLESMAAKAEEFGIEVDDELWRVYCKHQASVGNINVVAQVLRDRKDLLTFPLINNDLVKGFTRNRQVDATVECLKVLQDLEQPSNDSLGRFVYEVVQAMSKDPDRLKLQNAVQILMEKMAKEKLYVPKSHFHGVVKLCNKTELESIVPYTERLQSPQDIVLSKMGHTSFALRGRSVAELEQIYANIEEGNKEAQMKVLQALLISHATCNDYENVFRCKKEIEEGGHQLAKVAHAYIIEMYAHLGRMEEALKYKQDLETKFPDFFLDKNKYTTLITLLLKMGKDEDAFSLTNEMFAKHGIKAFSQNLLSNFIGSLVKGGVAKQALDLFDKLVTSNMAIPKAPILAPIVRDFLEKDDLEGANRVLSSIVVRYRLAPLFHEYMVTLIRRGNTDALGTAMDLLGSNFADIQTLHSLCFAFISAGKIQEAQKLVDMLGFKALNPRIEWFAKLCVADMSEAHLLDLLELTKKMYGCDLDIVYFYLIRLYAICNNPDKCLKVWNTMQEEGVEPTDRTLRYLANVLNTFHKPIPFTVPERSPSAKYEKSDSMSEVTNSYNGKLEADLNQKLEAVQKKKQRITSEDLSELENMIKEVESNDALVGLAVLEKMMWAYFRAGNLEDGLGYRDKCEEFPEFVMSKDVISYLQMTYARRNDFENCQKLFDYGVEKGIVMDRGGLIQLIQFYINWEDFDGLFKLKERYENATQEDFPLMGQFVKALYNRDGLAVAIKYMESAIDEDKTKVYHAGLKSFFKLVIDRGEPVDQIYEFVSRQMAAGIDYPAKVVFLEHLHRLELEKADSVLQKYPSIKQNRDFFTRYATRLSFPKEHNPNATAILQYLLNVSKEEPFMDRSELYMLQVRACYETDDYEKGVEIMRAVENEGLTLGSHGRKMLGLLLRKHNQPVSFEIP